MPVDEKQSLALFSEMVRNLKVMIQKHPVAFPAFSAFVEHLGDVTDHVHEDNLRLCFFRLMPLGAVFMGYYDYILQNRVKESLERLLAKEMPEVRETIIYCINGLTVRALGDGEGRDVVDVKTLRTELEEDVLKGVDEETKQQILAKLIVGVKECLPRFTTDASREMIAIYDELAEACKREWSEVFSVIDKHMLRLDKEASIWLRT